MGTCKVCGTEFIKKNRQYCPDCSNKAAAIINTALHEDEIHKCELCGQDMTLCKC